MGKYDATLEQITNKLIVQYPKEKEIGFLKLHKISLILSKKTTKMSNSSYF
jgi:hypothetical protein